MKKLHLRLVKLLYEFEVEYLSKKDEKMADTAFETDTDSRVQLTP